MKDKYERFTHISMYIFCLGISIGLSLCSLIFLVAIGELYLKIGFMIFLNIFSIVLLLMSSKVFLTKIAIDETGIKKTYLGKVIKQLEWQQINDIKIRSSGYHNWIIMSADVINEKRLEHNIFIKDYITIRENKKVTSLIYKYANEAVKRKIFNQFNRDNIVQNNGD